jgi:hypothetical protein
MPVDRMPIEVLALRSVHHHVTGRLYRLRWRSGVKLVRRCRRPRHAFLTGSPDSCQPPFGSGTSPYPASYPPTRRWRPTPCCPRFPVAFRPPAFASGSSFAHCGVGPSSRSGYRPRATRGRTSTGLPRSTHTRCDRGWAPPIPRQRRCSYGRNLIFRPTACRLPTARLLPPHWTIPSARLSLTRHQTGVHTIRPSGLPLTCRPRDGTGTLGLES